MAVYEQIFPAVTIVNIFGLTSSIGVTPGTTSYDLVCHSHTCNIICIYIYIYIYIYKACTHAYQLTN